MTSHSEAWLNILPNAEFWLVGVTKVIKTGEDQLKWNFIEYCPYAEFLLVDVIKEELAPITVNFPYAEFWLVGMIQVEEDQSKRTSIVNFPMLSSLLVDVINISPNTK